MVEKAILTPLDFPKVRNDSFSLILVYANGKHARDLQAHLVKYSVSMSHVGLILPYVALKAASTSYASAWRGFRSWKHTPPPSHLYRACLIG